MQDFSVFAYLYRDAGNFKVWGTVLLRGVVQPGDVEGLRECLESGELFVAEQVGVPVLYESLWAFSDGPTSDDHAYHEFLDLRPATAKEVSTTETWGELQDLLKAFRRAANNWKCALSRNVAR